MHKKGSFSIDNFINNKELNIMKAILPLLPSHMQKFMAIYIAINELSNIFKLFEVLGNGNFSQESNHNENLDIRTIFETIKKYLDPKEAEMYENYINIINVMKMYNEMSSMFENESSDENNTNAGFNMDILKSMLTPEQSAIFESLNNS